MSAQQLLPFYERELVLHRLYCKEFSARFPRIAGKLGIDGDQAVDPHIERLIESVALFSARIAKRLDDDFPQFTEAFLEVLFPHYLRPFPSCAIARLDPGRAAKEAMSTVETIARGTQWKSAPVAGVECLFKTAYPLCIAPLELTHAGFEPIIDAPASVRLPLEVTSSIRFTLQGLSPKMPLAQLDIQALRVFIDGEPSFCAALRDALFLRSVRAYVEIEHGRWTALPHIPVAAAGFANDDALIPFPARSHPAYRVLTEYFSFPEKFNFFDIDFATLKRYLPAACQRVTVHLAVTGLRTDSSLARMLASLSAGNLLLSCSPVVNLFSKTTVPIHVTHTAADYTVLADPSHAQAYDVHSIDDVQLLQRGAHGDTLTQFHPFYSLRHADDADRQGHYWVTRRDAALAVASPGHERSIAFVDIDCAPIAVRSIDVLVTATCSNRDLPTKLGHGLAGGDLTPVAGEGLPLRFLRRPTPPYRFESGHGLHWRLISHLTLNHHSLVQQGVRGFREMLTLYDLPRSPISRRQIGGIVGLAHAPATAWQRSKRGASLAHGIEVRLTLDEEAFVGNGIHLFAQVIDQFLGLYVQLNNFIQLVVISHQSGEELIRCKPRSGNLHPV